MPCGELVGDDFTLNWDTEDPYSFATPTWEEQTSLGDIEIDVSKVRIEIPKRTPTKTTQGGRQEWSLSFTMNYSRTNLFHLAVLAAIRDAEPIHLGVADGTIDDDATNLYHAIWHLTGPISASIDEGVTVEVEGSPHACAEDDEAPEWVDLTA